jgi:hypothetical protein
MGYEKITAQGRHLHGSDKKICPARISAWTDF